MAQRLTALFAMYLLVASAPGCSILQRKLPQPLTWSLTLEIDAPAPTREALLAQTVNIIEKRLDAIGVSGFQVKSEGSPATGHILVSLPEVPDRKRVKRIITTWGRLELVHIISPASPAPVQIYSTQEEAIASLGQQSSTSNRRVLPYLEGEDSTESTLTTSQKPKQWLVVEHPPIIDSSNLRNAEAMKSVGDEKYYEISFSLNAAGADKFGTWTGAHINEYLGVVLNNQVKSVVFIRSQIWDNGVINGRFTKESAEDLAQVLKSGALPAPIKVVDAQNIK